MKNILILHGTDGSSNSSWLPWLKKELENKNYKVWVPDLPRSDKPSIKRYSKHILDNKNWNFDEESVLVGHSSGAVAILGLLQHLGKGVKVDTCILVGSFKDSLGWDALDELFEEEFDFEKIKSRAKKFIFVHSDNDPYCPLDHAKYLAKKLDGELIIKKGQKHFSVSTFGEKYKEFPLVLDLIG